MTTAALVEIAAGDLGDEDHFQRQVVALCRPVVLRGLVADWPAVKAAAKSPAAFRGYLADFQRDGPVEAFFGDAAIAGKYYYDAELRGFNFERRKMGFVAALDSILAGLENGESRSIYVGSVPIDPYLPGFVTDNPMPLTPLQAAPRIWLGHAANVSCHYDTMDNLACVVAGRRRFTLYAPEMVDRLYVGPIDHTMAGQPVSLAASAPANDPRFPRFEAIREQALTVELAAGDALYLPKLWWHQVESTGPFNGLINYWWDAFSHGPDAPYASLLLAMIAVSERPAPERAAWRAFFDHYVFRPEGHPLRHLPEEKHGLLGPLKPDNYGRIRARIMHMLRGGH